MGTSGLNAVRVAGGLRWRLSEDQVGGSVGSGC